MKLLDADQNPVNKIMTAHDGIHGQIVTKKFYMMATETSHYYEDVKLEIEQYVSGNWEEFQLDGWTVKLISGEREPTPEEWGDVETGAFCMLGDIGTTEEADNDPKPFWIRLAAPRFSQSGIYRDFRVKVSYYRQVVGS